MVFLQKLKLYMPARHKDARRLSNKLDELQEEQLHIYKTLIDTDGLGKLGAMMHYAHMPKHYRYIFEQMYILNASNTEQPICIDCGGHIGAFADIALHCGAIVHIFEPNKYLFAFLEQKYKDNPNAILHNQAVSNRNYRTHFLIDSDGLLSQGNRIVESIHTTQESYEVEVIDLNGFIEHTILKQHQQVRFLKLDVEGSEFEIMDSLLEKDLHTRIDYIACETHERFFIDGKEKLAKLKKTIKEKGAKHIFLDWI